jgi:hypothetical protein
VTFSSAWPVGNGVISNLVKRIVVLESEEFVAHELSGREVNNNGHPSPTAVARHGVAAGKAVTTTPEPKPEAAAAPLKRPVEAWNGLGLKDVARRAAREAEHQ